jgi:hypothetical protein
MKNLVINIKPDGSTVVEANGFQGVGCKDASKVFEMAVAGPGGDTDTKPKPEFYQANGSLNTASN